MICIHTYIHNSLDTIGSLLHIIKLIITILSIAGQAYMSLNCLRQMSLLRIVSITHSILNYKNETKILISNIKGGKIDYADLSLSVKLINFWPIVFSTKKSANMIFTKVMT